jgi:hypothetical protein
MSANNKLFTIARNLPGDDQDKPNGLLFASPEFITDSDMEAVFNDTQLRTLLPAGKPVLCIRYHKDADARFGFGEEWRLVMTTLSYYMMPLNDAHGHVSIIWEENNAGTVEVKRASYQALVNNCVELFRTVGCEGCTKKGKECVEQQVGYRPWPFTLSYNRRDEWSVTLAADGNINDRYQHNKEHELQGADLAAVQKSLTKMTVVGFTYVAPSKTKLTTSPKMNHPLRPARDHRFFKTKGGAADKEAAAGA